MTRPFPLWLTAAAVGLVGCATGGGTLMSRTTAPAGRHESASIAKPPVSPPPAGTVARRPDIPASVTRRPKPAVSPAAMTGPEEESEGITLVAAEKPAVPEVAPAAESSSEGAPKATTPPAPALPSSPAPEIVPTDPAMGTSTLDDLAALPPSPDGNPIALSQVVDSIYRSYPLLEVAVYGRNIAAGEQLMAEGAYDLKLKATSDNTPLGFYRTYRQSVGVEQNLYFGGEVFGGYKVGGGEFEPWYLERQTNDGGEFRAGMTLPLAQNRAIDERRAELWRSTYGRNVVEPIIQAQVILFIYGGSLAYWDWVAAGQNVRYAQELYDLAMKRDAILRPRANLGAAAEMDLVDNQRLIVSRQVKLIDAQRKFQQTAVKLSLFLRDANGQPFVPGVEQLPPGFPEPAAVTMEQLPADIAEALGRRPELRELDFNRRIAEIDLAQAHNMTQPELDATFWGAQDVGGLTSSKGDKQPFEFQGSINFTMPLQRRKAQGKIWSTEGKIAQINAKREFTADKIETEVRNATIALTTAYQSLAQARESVKLNLEMEKYEQTLFKGGASDLIRVNIREQQTFDARVTEVEALLRYFEAQAELRAALGLDADGASNITTMP